MAGARKAEPGQWHRSSLKVGNVSTPAGYIDFDDPGKTTRETITSHVAKMYGPESEESDIHTQSKKWTRRDVSPRSGERSTA